MTRPVSRTGGEVWGPLAVVVGVLVVVIPLVYLGPGGLGIGPIGFAVLVMEGIAGAVGLGVIGAGVYSYRTGNPRPAVTVVVLIGSLVTIGGIGAYVEVRSGLLVPVPVWALAGLLAVGVSLGVAVRLTPGE